RPGGRGLGRGGLGGRIDDRLLHDPAVRMFRHADPRTPLTPKLYVRSPVRATALQPVREPHSGQRAMAAAQASRGISNSSSRSTRRRTLAISTAGGWKAASVRAARRQAKKRRVGPIDSRPMATKAAIFPQKKGLAS